MTVVDVLVLLLIVAFTSVSGINDGGNLIGTYLSSSRLRPVVVVTLLLTSILAGPLIFGTRVSHTIAVEIVDFQVAGHVVLMLSLLGAVLTLLVTWYLSIPTSTTLALAGAMVGAVLADGHLNWVHWSGILKVLVGLVGSVVIGFGVAFVVTALLWMAMRRYPHIGFGGARAQVLTVIFQGLAYGANDQEKAIGLTALFFLLVSHGTHYHVTPWAIVLPWFFWMVGFFTGGLRIAKTVSGHIFRLRPMQAVSTQLSAAVTVASAALLGFPVSTTQTTDGSLFGTGTALHPYQVRWVTVTKFIKVWLLTLPLAIVMGALAMGVNRLVHSF
ncbi:MAG: inorganic phosphate transporter [Firmicutes bacterium]|nr:inorganic phosphate transporter [Bacillota bacterium]